MLKSLIFLIFISTALNPSLALGSNEEMNQRPAVQKPGTRIADACGSHTVSRFVGAEATPAIRSAITIATGHNRIRWIKPGTAVTQDFRADRLNIILDQAERVLTMRCG